MFKANFRLLKVHIRSQIQPIYKIGAYIWKNMVKTHKILLRRRTTKNGFTTKGPNSKGRQLIGPNHKRQNFSKGRKKGRKGGPSHARSRFDPPARFGSFLFTEYQMVEEI
jgi:hypothetical protein